MHKEVIDRINSFFYKKSHGYDLETLEIAQELQKKQFFFLKFYIKEYTIISDSLSTFLTLKNYYSKNEITQTIQEMLSN